MAQVRPPTRSTPPHLPDPIRRLLGQLDRRLRAGAVFRGLGITAFVAALGAALGMTADFMLVLPLAVRWGIWGGWLVAVGFLFVSRVVGPLVRKADHLELAAIAERAEPSLGERLSAVVGLLGRSGRLNGSPELVAALAGSASAYAGVMDPSRLVALRGSTRRLALGGLMLALVVAPGLIWPDPFAALARRFVAPWADLDRVGRYVLTVAPGDGSAALGADLVVSAQVHPRYGQDPASASAWLEWTDEGKGKRTPRRVAMPETLGSRSPVGTRAFSVTLPRLAGSLRYRIVSGSAVSRTFRIKAIEPPAVVAVEARVEPPAYTGLPPALARDPGRIEAWEGSRILLGISASRPVRAVEVGWPKRLKPVAAVLGPDRKRALATLIAEESGPYTLALRDEEDLAGSVEPLRRLVVRADAPPVVAVPAGPAPMTEASAGDTLRLAVAARDDVAVASVELHYAIQRGGAEPTAVAEGGGPGCVAAAVKGLGTRSARGEASLSFGPLGLRPGDTLSYRVRVADNRPAPRGPNVVWLPAGTLAIVAQVESLQARQARAEREAFQAKIDALKAANAENRKETEQLRYAADAVLRGNGQWDRDRQQALTRREAEARGVSDRLQLLARELAADSRFGLLARPTRQVAEVEAEASRAMLEQAGGQADPTRRLNDLRQADSRLAAVSTRLDDLQRQFDALARGEAELRQLRDLASREAALADQAADKAADRSQLDRLQTEQAAVEKDLETLLKNSPALRADVLAAQAAEAETLARRARDLAARQRDEARRATDLSAQGKELKALAEAQRALEDDARRLALEVDPALAESGRGRLNTDPVHQAAEPIERGDLDQARQRLEHAESELRRLARDLEDIPGDSQALAQRLARRQDALGSQVAEAIREHKPAQGEPTAEEKNALANRLAPLLVRQAEIARLAETIQGPADAAPGSEAAKRFPVDAALAAFQSTARAVEALKTLAPRDIEERQNAARRDLRRLADLLPDASRRQEPARRQVDEARRRSEGVARDLERHLRETAPHPGRPHDPNRAAEDLANRLTALAPIQAKVADALAKGTLESEPRHEPQRDRAARSARALAEALKQVADPKDASSPLAAREALRAALPAAQLEARTALDRLQQKIQGRVPADDLAAELADDQRALQERTNPPVDRAVEAADQRRIATALRALPAPDAPLAQAEAVRQAEQAALALADPDPSHSPREAVAGAVEAVRALADRLGGRQAMSAPGLPAQPEVAAAPVDRELEIGAKQAEAASQLARRERLLRERLQTILGERAEPQQVLSQEAAALGRELTGLGERARPLSPRAHGPAHEAAQLLGEQAPRAMDQGVDQLAKGQSAAARDSQRRAAEIVERGAQQAEDLAASLRADRPAEAPPTPGQAGPHGPLDAAREAMRQAARQLDQARNPAPEGRQAAQAAQQTLNQAAQDLNAAANQAASRQGQGQGQGEEPGPAESALAGQGEPGPGGPQGRNRDPKGAVAAPGSLDLSELKALIQSKTGRAWGELPGHLRTEILQMSQSRYRDDYARLIQLYFQEIATGDAPRP
ncbi:hypothetical protein SAMN05444166_3793 [Singulisphaera sp. GP187]|uniref:DUF4175 family protein n=1 Tax=Singulisphaera sp. GP187 TaxID=1882752 RepID=UPI000926FC5E|nr:hypothetical protein [Singulisphaera sp. GP187]SIO32490.1 hypothetical protein SAMN05444166_3793 [Singulisphaera sp. GP187]